MDAGITPSIDHGPGTVPHLLLDRVRRTPGAEAYTYPDRDEWHAVTWSDVYAAVVPLAAGLIARGVVAGERVAICAATSFSAILADLAIACAGGVAVPIYPATRDDETRTQTHRAGAVLTFADRPVLSSPVQHLDRLDDLAAEGRALLASDPGAVSRRIAALTADDPAWLIYTACDDGRTKGVCLTHRAATYGAVAVAQTGIVSPADRQLLWLPLAHVFGRALLLMGIRVGFPTAVDGRADRVADNLRATRPTFLGSVPHVLTKVCTLDSEDLGGRLRFAISGSARLSGEVIERFDRRGIPVLECYGITETAGPACANRPDMRRVGTVGVPLPGTRIRIDAAGELLIRSPGVMTGYDHDPAETAAALDSERWFHTGDLARIDADGFVTVTGRKKEVFKTSTGKYVCPAAISERFRAVLPGAELVVDGELRPYCVGLVFTSLPDPVVDAALDRLNTTLNRWEKVRRFSVIRTPLDTHDQSKAGRPIRERVLTRYATVTSGLYERGQFRNSG
ncbi:long-chain fatty acid--CoA ligase [Rhodococcus sp. HNM0563]|uniref:AMP-dependent synthetase/ligase n=1 Tax=unclassified Rhodococcus (in: high G+C Gram-positive bacteria) TaxID=192944 RepID=UPI00146E3371|nr:MULTISPECIES: AMP-binding protein [unclassified Rhodococcus (in: high G+C Gram-positive bacteria)]MCK0091021.1 AMP-binding protein [Rhodococcus sp. F64268]NLU60938.1 long-chain fatty acid--CoA ligase [Rhodococcus sp. HNM0563]